jgi:osmotically-inducible protein OsmY
VKGEAMVPVIPETEQDVTKAVVDHLAWDSRLNPTGITVAVRGKKVLLSGVVPTAQERRIAEQDVRSIPGVDDVENHIDVKETASRTLNDATIKAAVETAFMITSDIEPAGISVEVRNGEVTLRGTVDTYWQKARARDIASTLSGVTQVHTLLSVVPTHLLSDEQVADDIFAALRRTMHINTDEISLKVEQGIVTISGVVPDIESYHAAASIAGYTRGVRDVINELAILSQGNRYVP